MHLKIVSRNVYVSSINLITKQFVTVSGKMSSTLTTNIGTPQGSRLSPLLFLCLLADMDLWTENSKLSNYILEWNLFELKMSTNCVS